MPMEVSIDLKARGAPVRTREFLPPGAQYANSTV